MKCVLVYFNRNIFALTCKCFATPIKTINVIILMYISVLYFESKYFFYRLKFKLHYIERYIVFPEKSIAYLFFKDYTFNRKTEKAYSIKKSLFIYFTDINYKE